MLEIYESRIDEVLDGMCIHCSFPLALALALLVTL